MNSTTRRFDLVRVSLFSLACAMLTFIITHDARATIAVVIVAGACGIAAL